MTEASTFVTVDRPVEGVAVVTMNRPERLNAMAFDVMVPVRERLVELGHDNAIRAIVVTGAGKGFLEDVVATLRRLHQPVIAAVNGAAVGGGLCLALACDIRIASPEAYFRAAGINNGLTASELGLSYLLPRAVGSSHAGDMMLTGRDVDAEEAARIGLVSRIADPVLDDALAIGEQITAFSQPGIEMTKRSLHAGIAAGSLESYMPMEGIGQLYLRLLTDNFEEAVKAREEGRDAVFRDDR
jgi:enoyl-CoA hydratase